MKRKIKITLVIALLLALVSGIYIFFLVESEGVRFGQVYRSTVRGYFMKSMEAEMLLGVDSSITQTSADASGVEGSSANGITKRIEELNPWEFSGSTDWKDTLEKVQGTAYACVDYKRFYYNGGTFFDTNYRILDVQPLEPQLKLGDVYESEKIPSGTRGSAQAVGYIVQASRTGKFIKSLEIVYQEGRSGNKFSLATIKDEGLYEFAVKCVRSGAYVRIYYTDQGIFGKMDFTALTRYRPYKIEVLDFAVKDQNDAKSMSFSE